jgi:probable HAF family extracellular repeat protein
MSIETIILGTLGGPWSEAYSVSADGLTVVGMSPLSNGTINAFSWTQAAGMVNLNTRGSARAVSADGSVVAGQRVYSSTTTRACRWISGAYAELDTLGGTLGIARAVSADGSVAVGATTLSNGTYRAARWANGDAPQDLGTLAGHPTAYASHAYGVSHDGAVVVGEASDGMFIRAFRWTAGGGMVALPTPTGGNACALSVNADGSIIAGVDFASSSGSACRWVNGVYESISPVLSRAYAITPDGSVIAGVTAAGENPRTLFFHRTSTGAVTPALDLFIAPVDFSGISSNGYTVAGTTKPAGWERGFVLTYIPETQPDPDPEPPPFSSFWTGFTNCKELE